MEVPATKPTKERVMQSTASSPVHATSSTISLPAPVLLHAFAQIPDPRRRQGTRYPLPAMLTLALAALLANHTSLLAIAEWGAAQSTAIKRALGFPSAATPHVSTLQRLFRRLDICGVNPIHRTRLKRGISLSG